jgi:hypothetical protein
MTRYRVQVDTNISEEPALSGVSKFIQNVCLQPSTRLDSVTTKKTTIAS